MMMNDGEEDLVRDETESEDDSWGIIWSAMRRNEFQQF